MATSLYLVSKHANLIRAGVKTAIVKSRKFDIGFQQLRLITKIEGQGYDFGEIILSAAIEIFDDDFKRLRSQHRITDNERKDWAKKQKLWGKEPLYFYKIVSRKLLKTPKEIEIPRGIQTIKHSQILGIINLEFITPLKPFVNTKIPKSNEFFSTKDLSDFDFSKHLVEFKLRGIRIQLHKDGDVVNGYTRFGNRIPQMRLEPVLQELRNQEAYSLILDGELFIPGGNENDVFTAISYEPRPNIEVAVFDILHMDGRNLIRETLGKRKEILEGAVDSGNHLKILKPIEDFSIDSIGQLTEQVMETEELEGFVFKDKNSKYLPTENVKWFKFVMIDKFLPEKGVETMGTTELKKNRILFRRLLRKLDEGKSAPMERVHIETMLDDINEKCEIPENWDANDFGLKFERVNRENVKGLTKDVLLGMHYRTHQHFKRLLGYKHYSGKSMATTINAHYWLSQEMIRRGFKHHFQSSLDTMSIRFRGHMRATDKIQVRKFIKNVKTYNPKKQSKEKLIRDWQIICMWWAGIREGKEFKYSEKQILTLAERILREMQKRGIDSHPESMEPYSRELYSKVMKRIKDSKRFGLMPIYRGELSEEGEKIKLTDLTDRVEECILIEDFVTVVGSLVNWRETEGDIDILVKAPADSDIFRLIRWRFMRAFPEFKERFHFSEYGMWQGPFSIIGNEIIVIKKDDSLSFQKFEDFWEEIDAEISVDRLFEEKKLVGYETLAYDGQYEKFVKLDSIIRHRFSGDLTEVIQRRGFVTATKNHSLFDENFIESKPNENKSLFTFKQTLNPKIITKIRLKDFFEKGRGRPIPYNLVFETDDEIKALLRLFAWYITEGHLNQGRLSIKNKNLDYLKSIEQAAKIVAPKIYGSLKFSWNIWQLRLCSKALGRMIKFYSSERSFNKKIPNFVFNLRDDFKMFFWQELLKGDGHLKTQTLTTNSKILAIQTRYLLASMGIQTSTRVQKYEKYKDIYYTKPICNLDKSHEQVKRLNKVKVENEFLYDLVVPETQNFYVNHILAHNTSHEHLLDLKCTFSKHKGEVHEMATEQEIKEMGTKEPVESESPESFKKLPNFRELQNESKRKDSVKLFRPFYQQKPQHGRTRREAYNIDSLVEVTDKTWKDWKENGVYISQKKDGLTVQVHKDGNKIDIWSEDGNHQTPNLPTLVKQLAEKAGKWAVIGELEWYHDGKHQPRSDTAGIANHPGNPKEAEIRITIYDQFYSTEKGDIHNEPYAERRKEYLKISETSNIKVSKKEILVKDEKSLRKAVKEMSNAPGSEGAMVKRADINYPLEINPYPPTMVKFKKELQLIAKVIKVNPVKGAKAWNYDCALKDAPFVGTTFNTGIQAKVGDKILVSFVDISGYTDPETEKRWARWYAPHVLEKTTKPADSIAKAWKMVADTTGRFEDKKLPKI